MPTMCLPETGALILDDNVTSPLPLRSGRNVFITFPALTERIFSMSIDPR